MLDLTPGGWKGLDGLGEAALAELRPRAEHVMLRCLLLLKGHVQLTLSGPRHGRAYEVTKTGKLHIASAPGEAPAVLYGRLRQSITYQGPTWDGWTVSGEVGTNVEYARRLEFGGVHTVRQPVRVKIGGQWRTVKAGTVIRILPRPFMAPTMERVTPMLQEIMERGL